METKVHNDTIQYMIHLKKLQYKPGVNHTRSAVTSPGSVCIYSPMYTSGQCDVQLEGEQLISAGTYIKFTTLFCTLNDNYSH